MLWLSLFVMPLLAVAIDAAGSRARNYEPDAFGHEAHDFRILVPIWGQVKYLLNVSYLSHYGSRVTLCTTGHETDAFYAQLSEIARAHGFQIYQDAPPHPDKSAAPGMPEQTQRSTSGTIRDRLIRNVLQCVEEPYTVPLDADSTTSQPVSVLVGELQHKGFDIASIRVVPANSDQSPLTRLQRFEYRYAMQLRFILPWMISGACQVAKTSVLRDVMNRHSLFFQGNDVEIGVIAKARGYNVGHIPFEVLTDVPARTWPLLRQRLAWAGGEFRLFIVNCQLVRKHPFLWIYGGIVAIGGVGLRWMTFFTPGYGLLAASAMYICLVWYLHWKYRNAWLFLLPLYTLFSAMVMTPLGIVWYVKMAVEGNNWGLIRPGRSCGSPGAPGQRQLAA
jgi:hypothetical protein